MAWIDRREIRRIASVLVDAVQVDAAADLCSEDAATAIEVHFPSVVTRPLSRSDSIFGGSDLCSVDGFYVAASDFSPPTILFEDEVTDRRVRFTLLHELGHHLIAENPADFLDPIDKIAGADGDPQQVEELVCHDFAGRLILPDHLLNDLIPDLRRLSSDDVIKVHDDSDASWEATAVRLANLDETRAAVVLIRSSGSVDFAAGGSHGWWPRGSSVKKTGTLDRVLRTDHRIPVQQDVYRYSLPFEKQMYCDAVKVHDGLAVAVLRPLRMDGAFDPPVETEKPWDDVEFCDWCDEERTEDWCEVCNGRFCQCGRCGCNQLKR